MMRLVGCLYTRVMKTRSAKSKGKGHGSFRGGRRRCQRCKVVFNKASGERKALCPRCKTHCSRCDVELTADNWKGVIGKGGHYNYRCINCNAETIRLTTNKDRVRDYQLNKTYGITLNEYNRMLKAQDGKCWICKKEPTGRALSVDHKHVKGEKRRDPRGKRPNVRGLLCWHCNAAIAKFNDNPELLRNAADYLETLPAQEILNEV